MNIFKNIHIWLPSYFAQVFKRNCAQNQLVHIIFCFADHFEPRWGGVSLEKEVERVDKWLDKYPIAISGHSDSEGNMPKHTFFYPIDEYTPEVFEKIVEFCKKGHGEIEIQLHHDKDTYESLRGKLEYAKEVFDKWRVLSRDKNTQELRYGFIHGNWALDNSRKDGRCCGVNNELEILRETGCYADFTLPSAPSDTQVKKINSIYYARDTAAPKSHNTGVDVKVMTMDSRLRGNDRLLRRCAPRNDNGEDKDLMIIQGPLALNWKRRKIENSEIAFDNPPTSDRIDLWVDQKIGVRGNTEWIFVKVYTHGAQDENLRDEYFKNLSSMFQYLEEKYNDGANFKLHYVTAREMYNVIKAAEAGENEDPGRYRDYEVIK